MRPALRATIGRRHKMLNLELRLLGTQLLELRVGRQGDERTDEWRRGYQDGRFDREDADDETADNEPSECYEWIGCQFPIIDDAQEADDGELGDGSELDVEWAIFGREEEEEE
jgi:hypothetical protein